MATMKSLVGARVPRVEDPRLIRGLATYTDDLQLPRMLHAAFVRCQYAAGRITRIDASRARKGVAAVFTFDDMRGQVGRTPCIYPPEHDVERPLLADATVHHVRAPIAVVL